MNVDPYLIERWASDHFCVDGTGALCVRLAGRQVQLADVVDAARALPDAALPLVLRFPDVLQRQVQRLNELFAAVIDEAGYTGTYRGVYPLKANQSRSVVEAVVSAGASYHYGLETGTKAELLAALAEARDPEALIVVNGFKDDDYLRLALLGRRMARRTVVVIEKLSELPRVLALAAQMRVEPLLGVRARILSPSSGRWADSAGVHSKFGLTPAELLLAWQQLVDAGMAHCLQLLHFHIGSQVADIRSIKDALAEGARVYAQLRGHGAPIAYVDVGGGLAVDYTGARTAEASSANYSMRDYVEDVVYILMQVCDLEDAPHPTIVSESGRAVAAHHACVIAEVVAHTGATPADYPTAPVADEHVIVGNMRDVLAELAPDYFQEGWRDALQARTACEEAFRLGALSLTERATVHTLFRRICERLHELKAAVDFVPAEMRAVDAYLSQQAICNFSVFQ
jgi:arginine decarboxylase